MVAYNPTPKAAIAGLLLGTIGMVEVIAAFTPGYDGGFLGLVLAVIGGVLCIYSVGKTRHRLAAIGGCVNGVALVLAIMGFILASIGAFESEEDEIRRSLLAIYSSNVVAQVNNALRNNGRRVAVHSEIRDACEVWHDADYRPYLGAELDDDWDQIALALYDWREDNDKTDAQMARLQEVWSAVFSATKVLRRDLDTIFDGRDFCEFKLDG